MRTSSAANVGADKDSEKRQRVAIEAFAKRGALEIVDWFYDPAVSGADPIEARPGFSALLDRLESNGVQTVVVEDATRFARDLVAQELGLLLLIKRGVRVLTASGDDLTETVDPSRVMMRQIAGSFSQYEKTRLVLKLRGGQRETGTANALNALYEADRVVHTAEVGSKTLPHLKEHECADFYFLDNQSPLARPARNSLGHDAAWPLRCGKSRPVVDYGGSGRLITV